MTIIEDSVIEEVALLGPNVLGLYCYLERLVNKDGSWQTTMGELAAVFRCTPRHVRDLCKVLEDAGFLVREEVTGRTGMTIGIRITLPKHLRTNREEVAPELGAEVGAELSCAHDVTSRSYVVRSSPPVSPKGDAPKENRGSRVPEDFAVDAALLAWAAEKQIPPAVIPEQTEAFVGYWKQQAGARSRKLDWRAAWQTWMRNWLERHPGAKATVRSVDNLPLPFRERWELFQGERVGLGYPPAKTYPATLQADIDHWVSTGEIRMLQPKRLQA